MVSIVLREVMKLVCKIVSRLIAFMILIISATFCRYGDVKVVVRDAVCEDSVPLVNAISPLSRLNGLCVVDDHRFLLCSDEGVYLYKDGLQSGQIGRNGRATDEYLLPHLVRVEKDVIYIWCAMSLHFYLFDFNGNFINKISYDSAISDFCVYDDYIVIYNAGKRKSNVIDLYSLSRKEVVGTLMPSSDEHVALLRYFANDPLLIEDGVVYFSSKDDTEIFGYDLETESYICYPEVAFHSDTFTKEKWRDGIDRWKYIDRNSLAVGLGKIKDDFVYLAMEGYVRNDEAVSDYADRYYSLYSLKGKKVCQTCFSYDSMGDPALFCFYDGKLYYLYHYIKEEQDHYELRYVNCSISSS